MTVDISSTPILTLQLPEKMQYYVIGKFHPRPGHEGTEGGNVWLYSFLNLGAR
jgi:hypothetical protein